MKKNYKKFENVLKKLKKCKKTTIKLRFFVTKLKHRTKFNKKWSKFERNERVGSFLYTL